MSSSPSRRTRAPTPPVRPAAAVDAPVPVAAAETPVVTSTPRASVTAQVDPFGQLTAFFGLPGAPATSAPSIGAFPILTRLTLEDLFTGTGPATVTNPTAVVTGLFNQVLRADPTAAELQNYLGIFSLTGAYLGSGQLSYFFPIISYLG